MIVFGPDGQPLASTARPSLDKDRAGSPAADCERRDSETLQLYRLVDGRPYQLVLAPVLAPESIGWAAMGFALDDARGRGHVAAAGCRCVVRRGRGSEATPYVATSAPTAGTPSVGA